MVNHLHIEIQPVDRNNCYDIFLHNITATLSFLKKYVCMFCMSVLYKEKQYSLSCICNRDYYKLCKLNSHSFVSVTRQENLPKMIDLASMVEMNGQTLLHFNAQYSIYVTS